MDQVAPGPIRHAAKMSVPDSGTQFDFLGESHTGRVPAFASTTQSRARFTQENPPKTILTRGGMTPPPTVQVTPMTMDNMAQVHTAPIPKTNVSHGDDFTSTRANVSVLQDEIGAGMTTPNESAFLPNASASNQMSSIQERWKRSKKTSHQLTSAVDVMAEEIFNAPEGTFEVDTQSFGSYFANMFDTDPSEYRTQLQQEESQVYMTEHLPGGNDVLHTAERIIKESVPISYCNEQPYDPLVSIVVLGVERVTGIKIPKRDISNFYNQYGGLDLNSKTIWDFRTSHVFGIKFGMAGQLKLVDQEGFLHKNIGNEQVRALACLYLIAEAPLILRSAACKYKASIKKVVGVDPNEFSWTSE